MACSDSPNLCDLFGAMLWGPQQQLDSSLSPPTVPQEAAAGSGKSMSASATRAELIAPPPRFTRLSAGARSAASVQTPSPRRDNADADGKKVTPEKNSPASATTSGGASSDGAESSKIM